MGRWADWEVLQVIRKTQLQSRPDTKKPPCHLLQQKEGCLRPRVRVHSCLVYHSATTLRLGPRWVLTEDVISGGFVVPSPTLPSTVSQSEANNGKSRMEVSVFGYALPTAHTPPPGKLGLHSPDTTPRWKNVCRCPSAGVPSWSPGSPETRHRDCLLPFLPMLGRAVGVHGPQRGQRCCDETHRIPRRLSGFPPGRACICWLHFPWVLRRRFYFQI